MSDTTEREQIVAWWRRVPWWGFLSGMAFAFGVARFGQAEYIDAAINWLISVGLMVQAIQTKESPHG